ncbi:MAG: thiol:disulfide interchange protein DsbG [Candidatus Competibacteraceae bacterium]|nr:thiol:disulfide interchange protein DsbG [Candidatus Competibacteraceae bacterium]
MYPLNPKALGLGLLALLLGTTAPAQDYPGPIRFLIQSGVQILDSFSAPADMTGYVVSYGNDETSVVYLTPDGEHVLVGVMLDRYGTNLTQNQLATRNPKLPDYQAMWERAENATWIAEGAKAPKSIVYVIADPYCPYCHALWKASQPYQAAGLQTRWILISYLHQDSEAKAAAILEAEDPEIALKLHESDLDEGGLPLPERAPTPETLARIRANTALMEDFGLQGTPVLLYRNGAGQVHLIEGMPALGALDEIFDLPEQPLDDPTLERFR